MYIHDQRRSSDSIITQHEKKSVNFDELYSNKKLGAFVEKGKTYFRLFAPGAFKVSVVLFRKAEDKNGNELEMNRDLDGVWETEIDGEKYGYFYGYKVSHGKTKEEKVLCLDPYAKSVATYNDYYSPRKGMILNEDEYDWEGDDWLKRDWRDLIIYEMHVRDMTADNSSGSSMPGTYKGLVENGKNGGIDYIKNLGINAVEILPSQEFANIEIPYKESFKGKFNSWNPYERNHWGYMTAAFFAPDAYYSTKDNKIIPGEWSGQSGVQVNEFKDMVKAFHKEGISVVMDVVYNHISEYEIGNLKQIDKQYYFRLDDDGNYISESYCGNDFKTERPMARRMIVKSILYWMQEYHVDGFRFDLGKLIDWKTVETIIEEAKKINPAVIIVCEPWGGGYDPAGFSQRGWGAWNDQIRNGVKGENPIDGLGWIFGRWYGNNNSARIKSYVNGTLAKDEFGLFQKKEHSVNYLESHDGYTLGDFIRIGSGEAKADTVIKHIDSFVKLTPLQLKLNKLAAAFLFTAQGIAMISSGQEFARTKIIAKDREVKDPARGKLDHNSYNKDNATNYINYKHADINSELLNYYKGLIQLRNKYDAFRRAEYEDVHFFENKGNDFVIGYSVDNGDDQFAVLFNADREEAHKFALPGGSYDILVNGRSAGTTSLGIVQNEITVSPSTAIVLKLR